jgi:hypothetical protein
VDQHFQDSALIIFCGCFSHKSAVVVQVILNRLRLRLACLSRSVAIPAQSQLDLTSAFYTRQQTRRLIIFALFVGERRRVLYPFRARFATWKSTALGTIDLLGRLPLFQNPVYLVTFAEGASELVGCPVFRQ